MKKLKFILFAVIATFALSSCNTFSHSMKEPNVRVTLTSSDIELSEQFSAEITVHKVLFIDWERLFGKTETGSVEGAGSSTLASIPVIGNMTSDPSSSYALYKLMQEHPGYDVVVYPQYEKHKVAPILGTDLTSKTTVKVTARLGKLKK